MHLYFKKRLLGGKRIRKVDGREFVEHIYHKMLGK